MTAVFIKEIRQYFRSPIAYVYLTVMTFFCGFIFSTGNLLSQNGDIKVFFSSLFSTVIFIIPMLTMRQFSEEKKLKTQQLLFTLPLSLVQIVLGKYLATMAMVLSGLAVTLCYPLLLASMGSNPAVLTSAGNFLAALLLVSAVSALGLFISALTENQVISAIVTYTIILILWLVDSLAPFLGGGFLKRALLLFSLKSNYIEFSYGILNPSGVVYFTAFTVLFLLLTIAVIDGRRQ